MQRTLMIFLLFCAAGSLAQEPRYVTDKLLVQMRSGAGSDYRIIRSLSSGTQISIVGTSADGIWTEATTKGGTQGWVRTQYLTDVLPARDQLDEALGRSNSLEQSNETLALELNELKQSRTDLLNQITDSDSQLGSVSDELDQLKQISGRAVELDNENRRLIENAENLRARFDTMKAENQRLQDKLQSEDFMNGAMAVLLGAIIALVAPRLWPKRRRSSDWA